MEDGGDNRKRTRKSYNSKDESDASDNDVDGTFGVEAKRDNFGSDFEYDEDESGKFKGKRAIKDEYSTESEADERAEPAQSIVKELRDWTRTEEMDATLIGGEKVKIEPFNMDEELEEGRIDKETGEYIPNRSKKDEDAWLIGISMEEMERARLAEEQRRERAERPIMQPMDKEELLQNLLSFLELGESPAEALTRRRPAGGNRKFGNRGKRTLSMMTEAERAADANRTAEVEQITDICTLLVSLGMYDIYEMPREELYRLALS